MQEPKNASLSGTHPTRRDTNVAVLLLRIFFHSMGVSFFENIPYFSNSVIQGESHNRESHNWDWSSLIESN